MDKYVLKNGLYEVAIVKPTASYIAECKVSEGNTNHLWHRVPKADGFPLDEFLHITDIGVIVKYENGKVVSLEDGSLIPIVYIDRKAEIVVNKETWDMEKSLSNEDFVVDDKSLFESDKTYCVLMISDEQTIKELDSNKALDSVSVNREISFIGPNSYKMNEAGLAHRRNVDNLFELSDERFKKVFEEYNNTENIQLRKEKWEDLQIYDVATKQDVIDKIKDFREWSKMPEDMQKIIDKDDSSKIKVYKKVFVENKINGE